jgi:N-methylhydantoinase B
MTMDAVQTTVMNNRFNAIVEEASAALQRTAHTTFVKIVQDYQCALADAAGEIVAYPIQSGVSAFIGVPIRGVIDAIGIENLVPGDVIITNDPFTTNGVVTHMMDVTMVQPFFAEGRLAGFGWSFIHASDIGGAIPGSISPGFAETFQEGVRVRPAKLYRAGVLNREILDVFLDNSRISSEMWGDFQAMIAALGLMQRRLSQLIAEYGHDNVVKGMSDVLGFAERKARAMISRIPDGAYGFSDYVEGLEDGHFIHINLQMTVKGSEIVFDFSGTDPQVAAAYNYVNGSRANPYSLQALLYYFLTLEPDTPRNAGMLRPIQIHAPKGTVVNAEFPAAGGSRVATSTRVYDAVVGCLDQAVPGGVMAAGPGISGIIVVSAPDPSTGNDRVSVVNPICGGSGGRNGHDGVDGVDPRAGSLKNVPAEMIEVETVMRVRFYGTVQDSQAAGRWQGGAAVALEMENTGAVEATMTVRGMNRFHFQPWGVHGGRPGSLCTAVINPDTPRRTELERIDIVKLAPGDVIRLVSPAGGGFGDPRQRDRALIEKDLARGAISSGFAAAAYGYGVRETIPPAPASLSDTHDTFAFGARREAYNRAWPREMRAELARRVLKMRRRLQQPLLIAVTKRVAKEGRPVDLERLDSILAEEAARFGGA